MRFDREKLIFLSLCVLEDACLRSQQAPVPPSISIRLALATLYALGKADKSVFEAFWKAMREDVPTGASTPAQINTMRAGNVTRYFNAICVSVDAGYQVEYCSRMAEVMRAHRRG